MAINIIKEKTKNEDGVDYMQVEIANGDLRALEEIVDAYDVNDITDAIAFAISVMKESAGRPIAATRVDGTLRPFMPSGAIRKNARSTEENQ